MASVEKRESACGLGRVKALGRSIAIEQVTHSRPFEVLALQAHEGERKNIILVELRDFEFPHRLGLQAAVEGRLLFRPLTAG